MSALQLLYVATCFFHHIYRKSIDDQSQDEQSITLTANDKLAVVNLSMFFLYVLISNLGLYEAFNRPNFVNSVPYEFINSICYYNIAMVVILWTFEDRLKVDEVHYFSRTHFVHNFP